MDSEQIRQEALKMLDATIPQRDAIRWTFVQIIAMIDRNGFKIPTTPGDFLSGEVPLSVSDKRGPAR